VEAEAANHQYAPGAHQSGGEKLSSDKERDRYTANIGLLASLILSPRQLAESAPAR
jgi:hypothetical protein